MTLWDIDSFEEWLEYFSAKMRQWNTILGLCLLVAGILLAALAGTITGIAKKDGDPRDNPLYIILKIAGAVLAVIGAVLAVAIGWNV